MTEKPLVSVIINCYNGERFLREAIDSVIAQTYENWELVFWDNQSTDSTRKIIESYASDKIHYYYAPTHTSLGEARNMALSKVDGDYICFLDADDIWMPEFLSDNMALLIKNDRNLVYCKYKNVSPKRSWYSKGGGKIRDVNAKYILRQYYIAMSGCVFSRKVIEENAISFNTGFSLIEDYDFFSKIIVRAPIIYNPNPLVVYRHHSSNLSHTNKWIAEYDKLISLTKEGTPGYEGHQSYLKQIILISNVYRIRCNIDDKQYLRAIKYIVKSCLWDITYLRYFLSVITNNRL